MTNNQLDLYRVETALTSLSKFNVCLYYNPSKKLMIVINGSIMVKLKKGISTKTISLFDFYESKN